MLQQTAPFHVPLGAAVEYLRLLLELDDADSLVHLGCQPHGLIVQRVTRQQSWHELIARVVTIGLHRKCCQRYQIDAVAFFQRCQIGISQREPQHIADAGIVASSSTHPEHVMVAPLDVPRVILAQGVQYDVGPGPPVEDVAQDVQLVDGQTLDDVAYRNDKVVSTSRRDDRVYDDRHVCSLVNVIRTLVQQFLNDVCKLLRQRLAHFRTRIFGRHVTTDSHQSVDGDVIPVVNVLVSSLDQFQFFLRIVYQRA